MSAERVHAQVNLDNMNQLNEMEWLRVVMWLAGSSHLICTCI